jgi:hypothetical protein
VAIRLNERVQRRAAEKREVPTAEAPDLDELERRFYARMQLGRDGVAFVRSGVELVDQCVQALNATTLVVQKESKTSSEVVAAVRNGHQEIQQAFLLVEEVKNHLAAIREHRDIDANAREIESLSARIDTSLERVHQFGADLEAAIADMRTDIANLGSRLRRWVLALAVIATLVLIWLGVAQVSLAIHGWRLVRWS